MISSMSSIILGNETQSGTVHVWLSLVVIQSCTGSWYRWKLISDLGLSSSVGMFGHLSLLWWVATALALISGMTWIICSPEQVCCQMYKEWSRVTRETCSHFSLSYCNFIYFPFSPRSFEENQRVFRSFKYYIQNKTKFVCNFNWNNFV